MQVEKLSVQMGGEKRLWKKEIEKTERKNKRLKKIDEKKLEKERVKKREG